MEVQERSRSPSRKTSRVEQVVGRWLRRSRDLGSRSHSLSRDRRADGKTAESGQSDPRNYSFRFNIQIQRDAELHSHGLTLSGQSPILVQDVTPGGPADGRLVPGDQLVKISNVAVDDLTPEQAAEIIRECPDALTLTVLRTMLGPKSSFITPEKRAKLRSNPVKVHFAEEVEVNGHSQGNSLLFLPNVLKVYLENGQTKAFKFEPSTTVKDIVMTLKEKLSLSRIEHFALVLERQPSVTKLLLLHEEERIEQVVQRKEAHDYRCLFRVCFMPKNLQALLDEDPASFTYLYLQGVNDVLQERFAVEMRCNTALRLAALHMQERLASCGQSPKTNLKTLTKTWSIDNFVSSTLLRNMREKELKKAITYHMKKSQSQHDPKQRGLSVEQARIHYLEELGDLKSFGGKSFSATMMLQDRESMVTLLVGARYGVSQVVNHKLSILSTLTEFSSITRIELLPESDKVSLVKVYLQDIKPITLLLESVAAKDMSCLIAGYCRLFIDPNLNVFPWMDEDRKHRVSAEEGAAVNQSHVCPPNQHQGEFVGVSAAFACVSAGYVSRCGSDSDSSDADAGPPGPQVSHEEKPRPRLRSSSDPPPSEASDSCRSDSHGFTSPSSDSLDALEEDDFIACSSSADTSLCFAQLSQVVDLLPSPPEASEEDEAPDLGGRKVSEETDEPVQTAGESGSAGGHTAPPSTSSLSSNADCVFNFDRGDARCYYNLCSNITPDSARSPPHPQPEPAEEWDRAAADLEGVPILQPPPGFGDSSSDDEFFDARDRFTSPEEPTSGAKPRGAEGKPDLSSLGAGKHRDADHSRGVKEEGGARDAVPQLGRRSRKRRSFLDSDYTSRVSFPQPDPELQMLSLDPEPSEQTQNPSPTVSSLTHSEGEPAQLESKPIPARRPAPPSAPGGDGQTRKQEMEMEPDSMESKSVTIAMEAAAPSITVVRCRVDPDGKECSDRRSFAGAPADPDDPGQSSLSGARVGPPEKSRDQEGKITAEGEKDDWGAATRRSRGPPFNRGYDRAITSITAKLGAATEVTCPTFYSGPRLKGERTPEGVACEKVEQLRSVDSLQTPTGPPRSGMPVDGVEPPPPTRFPFQTCSPGFMGRLSASTLRGKIQQLPRYLSRSQESLNQPGGAPGPAGRQHASEKVGVTITGVDDVTRSADLEMESVDSDDSDTTVTGSEVDGEYLADSAAAPPPLPVQAEPRAPSLPPQAGPSGSTPGPITQPPASLLNSFHRDNSAAKTDTPGPARTFPSSPLVVTTQNLNGPGPPFHSQAAPAWTPAPAEPAPLFKPGPGCTSALASACESWAEGPQAPLDACGCPPVYSSCFGSGDGFDEELTVFEFSCRSQSSSATQSCGGASELSPLLSPLSDASTPPLSHRDAISRLAQQRYPEPPAGFQVLRLDVDKLLSLLEHGSAERCVSARHPRETCPAHFTENKRVLQVEARRLMSGCQKVVGDQRSPGDMLGALAESFRTLVDLAAVCLCFSECDRCERRHAEAVAGLADVARSFRDLCLAAERVSSRRSCQDLSRKLLAKQCTALTASVFCLTQLFRTLTAL
uniref:FERM and PDZ domain-containing protein 1 n=1 Tax=Tetraodon nigroviridis TaxID=99883 RepID=H3CG76_TETNG